MAMGERNAAALAAFSPGGSCHKTKVAILCHQSSSSPAKQRMLEVMLNGPFALQNRERRFHSHMCSRVQQGTMIWTRHLHALSK